MTTEENTTEIVEVPRNKGGRPRKDSYDQSSFLRRGEHEANEVIKRLKKAALKAVDTLEDVMDDKDADSKTKENAASSVLKHLATLIDQKNKDEITRKIAEVRVRGVKASGTTVEEEDDSPMLDFDTIPEEFAQQEQFSIVNLEKDE